jgi:hypothetical protein
MVNDSQTTRSKLIKHHGQTSSKQMVKTHQIHGQPSPTHMVNNYQKPWSTVIQKHGQTSAKTMVKHHQQPRLLLLLLLLLLLF